jgi:hypothetical protein
MMPPARVSWNGKDSGQGERKKRSCRTPKM